MLICYQKIVSPQFPVQRMLDGMHVSNALTIYMAKAHVLDNILGDWMGSVSYIFSKVAIQLPPWSGGGIKRKGDRRISKFDSKIGSGISRGKGRGRGRGGRGGHHS